MNYINYILLHKIKSAKPLHLEIARSVELATVDPNAVSFCRRPYLTIMLKVGKRDWSRVSLKHKQPKHRNYTKKRIALYVIFQ